MIWPGFIQPLGVRERRPLELLLVHQNFPGQFRELAPAWLAAGHRVSAIGTRPAVELEANGWSGLRYHPYQCPNGADHAAAIQHHASALRDDERLNPDLVIAHSGWGEAEPLKQIWPEASLIVYPELWGSERALGAGFDPQVNQLSEEDCQAIAAQNARTARALQGADAAVVPTRFQRDTFPANLRSRLALIHEGINTARLMPDPQASLTLANGQTFNRSQRLITYVSRRFERLRGLHTFLAALPPLLAADPDLQVVMVGGSGSGYGLEADHPQTQLEQALAQLPAALLHNRLHLLGALPYADLCKLLQISSAHVYLTYPYTLSWSLLEAMACGAPVVSNHSGPAAEVIASGRNGLLIDFNQPRELSRALRRLLADPVYARTLGANARRTVQHHYSLPLALARYNQLFKTLLAPASR
mgnify:CR=1 FL=1